MKEDDENHAEEHPEQMRKGGFQQKKEKPINIEEKKSENGTEKENLPSSHGFLPLTRQRFSQALCQRNAPDSKVGPSPNNATGA
ncbi:MAG TPA: hypothetical protein ENK02_15205 [Planctomycetes bacterium]|nr:hypothetical protein [Planctomycetota bacterium]